ncbi:MAG: Mur ligase family protein [Saprospiraceae bacterium]|nr:Mur ligase family protein [Saprospiraceae bacterium]
MRVHFIAIGGSAMHNLALALHDSGHIITGSDDEIYEPSRSRLEQEGLLPEQFGWYTDKIEPNIDAIILGMHARANNPELLRAQEMGIKIYSYPEFIAEQCRDKIRVVVAGSHGKTTTTSIIMHVLSEAGQEYDYLVGAQLEGFDRMVKLSDAGIIILEGDEYLSSPIDRRPKMMHYDPTIAIITGVAWDHINVFPTIEDYVSQFEQFVHTMKDDATLYYYEKDMHLTRIMEGGSHVCQAVPYDQIQLDDTNHVHVAGHDYKINLIGNHNLQNIKAAELVCSQLGISLSTFYEGIESFTGANKRLEQWRNTENGVGNIFLDFAHAPSKVKATTEAVRDWYPKAKLTAVLELHTFSSLNKDFIPQYKGALAAADEAVVFFSSHALKMKNMPELENDFIHEVFEHSNLKVISEKDELKEHLSQINVNETNLLLMTSGNFDKLPLKSIFNI